MTEITRRRFIAGSAAAAVLGSAGGRAAFGAEGTTYPGWRPGELDIHFIHTGEGECTFFIFPDGTTMLLDCGSKSGTRKPEYVAAIPAAPSGGRRAGEWQRRYMERLVKQREIDYLVFSHWHADHVLGLPDVLESFRFANYYDHQYPNHGLYSKHMSQESFDFVRKWLPGAQRDGMKVEPFKVGAKNQLRLRHDPRNCYSSTFEIRNVAANGSVWDGRDGVRDLAAIHVKATGDDKIPENQLSAALRIRYGGFTYFTGGDIEGNFTDERGAKHRYEGLVGRVVGPVEVCKTNHHAFFPSMGKEFLKATRPKLFLSSTWSPNQINDKSLSRMMSREIYPGDRTVAYGKIPDAKKAEYAGRDFMRGVAPEGHAVVKVAPGGGAYRLYTLSAGDESMRIVGTKDFTCG